MGAANINEAEAAQNWREPAWLPHRSKQEGDMLLKKNSWESTFKDMFKIYENVFISYNEKYGEIYIEADIYAH